MSLNMKHDVLEMTEYHTDPAVLVLADSEAGLIRGLQSAARAGCRVSDSFGIAGAAERLDRQVAAQAVIADFEADHGEMLDALLDRLEEGARSGRHRSVVSAPPELIDAISAHAIGLACASRPARLHDIGKGQGQAGSSN